jgi:hypothetical protein
MSGEEKMEVEYEAWRQSCKCCATCQHYSEDYNYDGWDCCRCAKWGEPMPHPDEERCADWE